MKILGVPGEQRKGGGDTRDFVKANVPAAPRTARLAAGLIRRYNAASTIM
jgi:hypothetical protein